MMSGKYKLMKQFYKTLAVLAIALLAIPMSAYDFTVDGIYYDIIDEAGADDSYGTVQVVARYSYTYEDSQYTGKVTIPENVTKDDKTYRVVKIGKEAFFASSVSEVILPESITTIDNYAFYSCQELKSFVFPAKVSNVGVCAFAMCTALQEVTFPAESWLSGLPYAMFKYCMALKEIHVPAGVQIIGENAFEYCTNLRTAIFDGQVTQIAEKAFGNCTALRTLTMSAVVPPAVTESSFEGIDFTDADGDWTVELYVPMNSTNAYEAKDIWKKFYVSPLWYDYLESGLYYEFESGNATLISANPYAVNNSNVVIPEYLNLPEVSYTVIAIDAGALKNKMVVNAPPRNKPDDGYPYDGAESISLPETIGSIGREAFMNNFVLKEITVPDKVEVIEQLTFANCESMTKVVLGRGVNKVYMNAFTGCDALMHIWCIGHLPAEVIDVDADENRTRSEESMLFPQVVYDNATLYVPADAIEEYLKAPGWKEFKHVKDIESAGVDAVALDNQDAPLEFYNLQGMRVSNPEHGIYILKQGKKTIKITL